MLLSKASRKKLAKIISAQQKMNHFSVLSELPMEYKKKFLLGGVQMIMFITT
ncbi:hypothetical protein RO3G_07766 [Rhizopus delemar RA 99-880]|uniref:Uncharacterized protein n=1 Tax=Rhizopus delemar (strain RA 99-880 / ATCC MYA-4621 / FGSC 9543 / NRRL 43880) TaxID=246409 RepID=I1C3N1_RHIO9|nr:hypothetical protein RO3G_07766 [Rhizopus delemar RA 99-880]|eukprot:EIE83061.1 hypothetical protein RO3G_07766 [Rhizopus delemar RA 99-880]